MTELLITLAALAITYSIWYLCDRYGPKDDDFMDMGGAV